MKRALVAMSILLATAPAWGQSKKYPPVPPDKDLEEEKRSHLWESTLRPDNRPYQELVRDARRLIEQNTPDNIKAAAMTRLHTPRLSRICTLLNQLDRVSPYSEHRSVRFWPDPQLRHSDLQVLRVLLCTPSSSSGPVRWSCLRR